MNAGAKINYPTTGDLWCDYFKALDIKFDTDKRSPLHHDNRCTNHGSN